MIAFLFGFLFGAITYGSAQATHTLVIYFDVSCEACHDFQKDIWPRLRKRWCGRSGPLRVIFKPYPHARETIIFMACCEQLKPPHQILLFETLMTKDVPSMVDMERCMKVFKKPFTPYTSAVLKEALYLTNYHQFIALPVMLMNGQRLSDDQQDNIIQYLEEILP